jgi:hypothetical protein
MIMSTPPRRRWSYSLRTMFVVVTAVAIPLGWLGWQLKIVRERNAAREWLRESREGGVPEYAAGLACTQNNPSNPFWRVWLGDEAAPVVLITDRLPKEQIDRIRKVFPEAEIIVCER